VMPAAVAGIIAYPFGLDGIAWSVMGWATVPVLAVARWVATFDRSVTVVPAFGTGALLLLALALLWATLWSTAVRLLAILPLVTGLALAARPERADIIIDREGAGALVRSADGKLVLLGRPSRFVLNQWLVSDGDGRKPDDPALRQGTTCDDDGCVVRLADGRSIAFSRNLQAVAEDCARADLVIAPLFWTGPCQARLMDRNALLQSGATSLRIVSGKSAADWPLTGTRSAQSQRLWSRKPPPQREAEPAPSRPGPPIPATPGPDEEPVQ
ncbi:MAG: ComEC/Rec2 family competence protein, partial [Bosea sp. (in: a-proteobacteria)]